MAESDDSPLSAEHRAAIQRAAETYRPLRRCAALARSSAVSMKVLGVLALLVGLASMELLVIAVAAAIVGLGLSEARGGRRLAAADPRAPAQLAWNQAGVFVVVTLYAVARMVAITRGEGAAGLISPEAAGMLGELSGSDNTARAIESMLLAFYGLVILLTAALQGGLAAHYLKRRGDLARYRTEVAAWVRELVEALSE